MISLTRKARESAVGRRKLSREAIWGYVFVGPWIIGFLVFTLAPVVASFGLSFMDYELISAPTWRGLRNYGELLTRDRLFRLSLYNTVYYTLFSVPLGIIVAFLLALLLNVQLPGMNLYRTVFYLPAVTAGVAVSLLWIWLFHPNFGPISGALKAIGIKKPPLWIWSEEWAMPALILMSSWGVGGSMIIYLAGLQGVPQSLYDAASIDGAGVFGRFRHITVPMMTPTIFFSLVMGLIGAWQMFTQSFIMTEGGPNNATLTAVLLIFRKAFHQFHMGYASAMAWVLFVIILFFTVLVIRSSAAWVFYEGELAR